MNVHLTPELEKLIQSKEKIRAQIEDGWQSAKRGELVDGDEVFDPFDAELAAMELHQ